MKKNIGRTDKWIRIVLGVALLAFALVAQSGWRWLGLIGIIPLVTAFLGYCPLYALLGISTNHEEHNSHA